MATKMLLDRVMALPSVPFSDRTKRLPQQPGLYFAIRDDAEILYVGMASKSIRQRWKTWHSAANHVTRNGLQDRVRIAFVLYRDIDQLKNDERAALREFSPILNFKNVPGALERQQRMVAEACRIIDCDEHWHHRWPQIETPTETKPCACIVHDRCAVNMAQRVSA